MSYRYITEEEENYIKMLFEISNDNSKYELYNEKIDAFNTKFIQFFFDRIDTINKEKIITNSNNRVENMVLILNCDREKAQKYCLIQEINNYLTPKRGDEEKTFFNYVIEFVGLRNFFANGFFFNLISFKMLFFNKEKNSECEVYNEKDFCNDIISLSCYLDNDIDYILDMHHLFYNDVVLSDKNKKKWEKESDDAKYEQIYQDLKPFIYGASADIYCSIIKDKKLPKNTDTITMLSENKPDIIRFGDCFGIEPAQLSEIFGVKVVPSDRNKTSINNLLRTLKKYNRNLYCKSSK